MSNIKCSLESFTEDWSEDEGSTKSTNTSAIYFSNYKQQIKNPLTLNKGSLSYNENTAGVKKQHYYSDAFQIIQQRAFINNNRQKHQIQMMPQIAQPTMSMHVLIDIDDEDIVKRRQSKNQVDQPQFQAFELEGNNSFNARLLGDKKYTQVVPEHQNLLDIPQPRHLQNSISSPINRVAKNSQRGRKSSRSKSKNQKNNEKLDEQGFGLKATGDQSSICQKKQFEGNTPKGSQRKRRASISKPRLKPVDGQQDCNTFKNSRTAYGRQSILRNSQTIKNKDEIFENEEMGLLQTQKSKKFSKDKLAKVISREFLGYDREDDEEELPLPQLQKNSSSNKNPQSEKEKFKNQMSSLKLQCLLDEQVDYVQNYFADKDEFEIYVNDYEYTRSVIKDVVRFSMIQYRNIKKKYKKYSQSKQETHQLTSFYIEKKTLVFDLDETLIRSEFRMKDGYDKKFSLQSRFSWTGRTTIYLFLRPYLMKMLKILRQDFEIVIFTASQEDYATKIMKCIDKEQNTFDYLLHREQCLQNEKIKVIVKDLSLLLSGRDIKDIILIDNKVCSYGLNFDNGIPIKDFMGDKNDKELLYLTSYIRRRFLHCYDVRDVIKKDFLDPINDLKKLYSIK